MKTHKMEVYGGATIQSACEEAVKIAAEQNCNVEFDFNGQIITATPTSDPAAMAKAFMDECQRAHDAYIASPEYKATELEYQRKQQEQKEKLAAALVDAPEHISLLDPQGWKKSCEVNSDPYGGAVMIYAEQWARLMEARMNKGEKLATIADECSQLADSEGITGFMYGCAVKILSQVWTHGEALRLWHNLKTQIGHEGEKANESGGVLNPALLTIG